MEQLGLYLGTPVVAKYERFYESERRIVGGEGVIILTNFYLQKIVNHWSTSAAIHRSFRARVKAGARICSYLISIACLRYSFLVSDIYGVRSTITLISDLVSGRGISAYTVHYRRI
jgi:hypothetical protein